MIKIDVNALKLLNTLKTLMKIRKIRERIEKGQKIDIDKEVDKIANKLGLDGKGREIVKAIILGDMDKIIDLFREIGLPEDVIDSTKEIVNIIVEELEEEEE